MMYKLAFVGFGTVGQGLAEILLSKRELLSQHYDFQCSVVAITDIHKGSIYLKEGLDLERVLATVRETRRLDGYPGATVGWDSLKTIRDCGADIVVEVTYTDIETGEPAISHVRAALESGKHVVTSNKGPVALAGRELVQLADQKGGSFRYEGTVLSGTPALNLALETLAGVEIKEVRGILNGTTNYILSEMEKGKGYQETLKRAQDLGYAEAKPDADVEGWDALAKILIIANLLMGGNLKVSDVARTGITGISLQDVETARQNNERWKLIAHAWREAGQVRAKVSPERVPTKDFLAGVCGVTNALTFGTDLLGEVTIVGPGAGKLETGFSLLVDMLSIHRRDVSAGGA
ncbi:MAG: homoserine dehydrogenase [candidate division Zixibacteria bacterium SM23_81]|nr:MAG: homoserine dehydrogenase [candidate division Zixibacteria bacterium SM23_81]